MPPRLSYLSGGNPQPAGGQIDTAIAADNAALSSSGVTVLTGVQGARHQRLRSDQGDRLQGPPHHHFEPTHPTASSMTLGGPPKYPTFAGCQAGLVEGLRPTTSPTSSPWTKPVPARHRHPQDGEVQVVELFSSGGNVVSNNFVALTDDKHLEGADYIVPVIRKSAASATG